MPIITPQKLVQLATGYPLLGNSWYILAACSFSSANKYKEIPPIFHMAIQQSLGQASTKETATKAFDIVKQIEQAKISGSQAPELQGISSKEQELTAKLQDALLKSLIITGVPRLINSLTAIRDTLPGNLSAETQTSRHISDGSNKENTDRGKEYFEKLYNKVASRVKNNLYTSYPDLHNFIVSSCYGQVISYPNIISPRETSLLFIATLVPQDVNPQFKGHLRGALNVGSTKEESNQARQMALDICQWCDIELQEVPHILK